MRPTGTRLSGVEATAPFDEDGPPRNELSHREITKCSPCLSFAIVGDRALAFSRSAGMRDSIRTHHVKLKHPRTGDVILFDHLSDSALGQPCYGHDLRSPAHDFDNLLGCHAGSLEISKRNAKKYLSHCLENSCCNGDMDIFAIRRQNLRRIIDSDPVAKGNDAAFGRKIGYDRSKIAQYLSPTYNNGRSPGERVARTLESLIGLPEMALDRPLNGADDTEDGRASDIARPPWPFDAIDEQLLAAQDEAVIRAIEYAMIKAADGLGVDVSKKSDRKERAA